MAEGFDISHDRLAVLVIASRSSPESVYELYLRRMWPETLRRGRDGMWPVDVFFVFGSDSRVDDLEELGIPPDNIIVAPSLETYSPGILLKTAHALRLLAARGYRNAFRTNISSLVAPERLLEHVHENRGRVTYSSGIVFWGLRQHLIKYGEDPAFLATLTAFESDAYCSGSGFFIDASEIAALLRRLPQLAAADPEHRLIDDVSIGLCLPPKDGSPRSLDGFTEVFTAGNEAEWPELALRPFAHARLEHLEPEAADRALDLLLPPRRATAHDAAL